MKEQHNPTVKSFMGTAFFVVLCFLLLPLKAAHCAESGYAAAGAKSIRLLNENAVFFEAGFGVMTGEYFTVGGRALFLTNEVAGGAGARQRRINYLNYGGVRLEYIQPVYEQVSVSLGTLAGFGWGVSEEVDFDLISTGFFGGPVIEPDVGIVIRLLPHLALCIEGSYFYMLDGAGLTNGAAGSATLRSQW